jgi:hypothetical protein
VNVLGAFCKMYKNVLIESWFLGDLVLRRLARQVTKSSQSHDFDFFEKTEKSPDLCGKSQSQVKSKS